ncbi:MAG: Uncharacterised protein [Cyanobium sp. ARS6]|nr:MAG: Uncharacterised protein [Cyanobium sp. ARS6]
MHIVGQTTNRSKQGDPIGNHVERLAPFDASETHHHRVKGIKPATDGFLEPRDHPRSDPDGINRLMRPGTVPGLTIDLDLQFTSRGRQAAAAQTHAAHRQAGKNVQTQKGVQPLSGSRLTHPASTLRDFFCRLKQQTHPNG